MRVPEPLSTAFGQPFQDLISQFATDQKLMPEASAIESPRFLARSVVPHIEKLSGLFNRLDKDQTEFNRNKRAKALAAEGLDPYWQESSNPKNLRLAYFLYFMPSNLYRVASVVAELGRLGFKWNSTPTLRALELGAGPASGACGVAAGERFGKIGIPRTGNWALIEQDKATLDLGARWAAEYFNFVTVIQKPPEAKAAAPHEADEPEGSEEGSEEDFEEDFEEESETEEAEFDATFMEDFDREFNSDEVQVEDPAHQEPAPPEEVEAEAEVEAESVQPFDWGIRTFHRKIDFKRGLLPPAAPKFNLWVGSYFLNESSLSPVEQANLFLDSWEKHLEEEGLVIMVEPALKVQSRKLLQLRAALIEEAKRRGDDWFQILLPCLGHQACGALAAPEDWCHEQVSWWRPPYFRTIDTMAGLDRKTLPFSYLVITKSTRPREEILPALAGTRDRQRLVSPTHKEGKELEFFMCGQEGKRRARYRPRGKLDPCKTLNRGDILIDSQYRGDTMATRIDSIKKKV